MGGLILSGVELYAAGNKLYAYQLICKTQSIMDTHSLQENV